MPSSLISATIRGIRSYAPHEKETQKIDFMPLTLIVGANGTGKTTIIESLKFIISGDEPPHSDCRRNFVHTPRQGSQAFHGKEDEYAAIKLEFKNSFGEKCIAKREIGRPRGGGPPSLSSSYKIGQSSWVLVHKQDDWNKVMPRLFGLPNQAILSNVILCHQEDNLWCMGDSNNVKQVFDKVFGCERYKREIRNIEEEIKKSRKTLQASEKEIIRHGANVERKRIIGSRMEHLSKEVSRLNTEMHDLNSEVKTLEAKKQASADRMKASEIRAQNLQNLKYQIRGLMDKDGTLKSSLSVLTYKRPPPVEKRPNQAIKKPPTDPIVADLDSVLENFDKMNNVLDKLPGSEDMSKLRVLIDETLGMVQRVKSRFAKAANEPPPPPSPEEPDREDEFIKQLEEKRMMIQTHVDENLIKLKGLREQVAAIAEEAHEDKDSEKTQEEFIEFERQLVRVRDSRSHKSGSKVQMERELANLKNEVHTYRDTNRQYAKSLGSFQSSQIIIDDLEKLRKCFTESISTFHDQMIIRINEVLKARWKQIYQGSDIESIELVDELVTRGKSQKSYNYYVAMRKHGTRMKMREKSSAGQRALAAIIMRMALAELFVRDFAFIALDEPTANLDLPNVQALAKSISAYVRMRSKKAANIQWIIITHDEQFLRALDEECSPYFYRIYMNKDDGYSNIVKLSCHDAIEAAAG